MLSLSLDISLMCFLIAAQFFSLLWHEKYGLCFFACLEKFGSAL